MTHDQEQPDQPAALDDDAELEEGPEDDPPRSRSTKPKQRPERQAARYRVERNEARRDRDALAEERDALRLQLAFLRAAGTRFVDADAAFKLADRSILTLDVDGTPLGAEEAVEALAAANPFLVAADDQAAKDSNPFKESPTVRKFNGPRKPIGSGLDRKTLEARYPALRRGR